MQLNVFYCSDALRQLRRMLRQLHIKIWCTNTCVGC